MTSTKAEPGPFDGLERAEPDEPVFPLRAHDALAAGLVHLWVRQRRESIEKAAAAGEITEEKRLLELEQAREAEEIAWAMEDWRSGQTPAPVATAKATYSGRPDTAEEIAARNRHVALREAARRIDNGVADAVEASEAIAPYGFDDVRMHIAADVASLKDLAELIRPKRASYAHMADE
jgi:hypothetical protein